MLLYRLIIHLLRLGLWLAAAGGHRKAKAAWHGRRGWLSRLEQAESTARSNGRSGPWIHFHCASLGEFEQGAPLIRLWRKQHPKTPILLTFFSPSGIEGASVEEVDHIDYLPFDTAGSMRAFARAIDLSDTVLVKYELWPEMMRALHRNGTRLHLMAARFDRGRHPLNNGGHWIRKHLRLLTTLQVQDPPSADALSPFGLMAQVTGDPRVDRVFSATQEPVAAPIQARLDRIRQWKGNRKLLVIGSAWPAEWKALEEVLRGHEDWVVLWAPHEVEHPDIQQWASREDTDCLSCWTGFTAGLGSDKAHEHRPGDPAMLIADEVGLLRFAYGLADFAVVGGGWGRGVHNVLEPAAFGAPVLCGPKVEGFREIEALKKAGALQVCHTTAELLDKCSQWIESDRDRERAGDAAAAWVVQQRGATARIANALESARSEGA